MGIRDAIRNAAGLDKSKPQTQDPNDNLPDSQEDFEDSPKKESKDSKKSRKSGGGGLPDSGEDFGQPAEDDAGGDPNDSLPDSQDDFGDGGNSQKNNDTGSKSSENKKKDNVQKIKDFLNPGSSLKEKAESKIEDASERLRKAVNEKDAVDRDIVNSNPSKENLFENSFERQLSAASGNELGSKKGLASSFYAQQFYRKNRQIEKAENNIDELQKNIENVRSSDRDKFRVDTKPESEGGVKSFSRSEYVDFLQNKKQTLEKNVNAVAENQFSRIKNISVLNKQIQRDKETLTEEEAKKIAKKSDLSESKTGEIRLLGRKLAEVGGEVSDAAAIADTLFSGDSGRSIGIIGSAIDAPLGEDDRKVENVAEINTLMETQELQSQGFQPLEELKEASLSAPGQLGLAYVGGQAFSGASKLIGQAPKVGSAASSAFKVGGAAAGTYLAGKQGQKALQQIRRGREGKGVVNAGFTVADAYQFYRGASDFASRFGPRKGTADLEQKNLLTKTDSGFEGSGSFEGQANILNTKFQTPVTRKGFRSPTKTLTDEVNVYGRYGIKGEDGFSDVQGRYRVEYPDEVKESSFESLSRQFDEGVTESGQKYFLSDDTSRFKTESRFFTNRKDVDSTTKSVRTNREKVSAEEAAKEFPDTPFSQDERIVKTSLSTVNAGSDTFSSVDNFVRGSGGSAGSSSGSSSSVLSTGGAGSARANVGRIIDESTQAYIARQTNAARAGISGVPSTSGGSQVEGQQAGLSKDLQTGLSGSNSRSLNLMQDNQQSFETVQVSRNSKSRSVQTSVNSTASGIVEREKNRFKQSSEVVEDVSQDVGTRSVVTPKEDVANLNEGPQTRQFNRLNQSQQITSVNQLGVAQGSTQGLRVVPVQAQSSMQGLSSLNNFALDSSSVSVPVRTQLGFGAAPVIEFESKYGSGFTGSKIEKRFSSSRGRVPLDWFSANLVEQKTEEEAVFSQNYASTTSLFGVKTVQEKSGEVESDKILESERDGGRKIW